MTALHVYAIHMTSPVPLSVSHPKFVLRITEVDLIWNNHGRTHMPSIHMLNIFKTNLNSRETVLKLMNFFDIKVETCLKLFRLQNNQIKKNKFTIFERYIYIYIGVFTTVFSGQNLSGVGTSVPVNRVKIRNKLMFNHLLVLTKSVHKLSFPTESIKQVHPFIYLSSLYTLPDMVSLRNDILSAVASIGSCCLKLKLYF